MSRSAETGRRPLILVVDDSPPAVRLLQAVLEPQGYSLIAATSGEEALALVAERRPDLVLLDVVMPGLDGFDVCRRLRADPSTHGLPILMVTASAGQEKVAALEAGADDFVQKPFDQPELFARVRSLLRIKHYQDRIAAQAAQLADLNRTLEQRVQEQVDELARLTRLRRFLPPQLADLLVTSEDEAILESHRAEIAVIFCGLRGFTAFSERAEPEEVLGVLRGFHEPAGELAQKQEATVGWFSSDGLMAFLNDPLPCAEPAVRAVRLAVAMRDLVDELAKGWRKRGHELGFAAAVAFGYATLGRMGFKGRWDYKPIGRVVNVAARLYEEAKRGQILISPRTQAAVEGIVAVEALPEIRLKGFRDPMACFNLLGVEPEAVTAREGLTAREIEVLRLVAEGLSNRAIADRLVISEKTAIRHVSNIFLKLDVHTRSQATRAALERALIEEAGAQ